MPTIDLRPPPTVSPPRLNIVMHVVGSRGDVQPFVALGKALKDTYSHRVRLATHPNLKGFVREQGLEFFSIGGDTTRPMAFMLWGDETVRLQERVSDMKTGVKAVGREFGFGFYDAITGLATQPVKGAQERGAACLGILSHTLQGASKEVQKIFGHEVQSYIIAPRPAQGYEEWLNSSDAEEQDIIVKWKSIQGDRMGKADAK
ncbi:hypothetical protein E8E11_006166 [Didymella keratinophila]|nr:hypothetical protein E8E11_006166 [Didymella keratinophila]